MSCYHHLLNFDVDFYLDGAFCVENMLILAKLGPKFHSKIPLTFSLEFVTFWDVTREREGPRQNMTKCDMGRGESKISIF